MTAVIRILDAAATRAHLDDLATVLARCVNHGASVSFMLPYGERDARGFWEGKVLPAVERGDTVLFGAFQGGLLAGTVQLQMAMPPNQPHRGDIAKLLVHPGARKAGLGGQLMAAAEAEAKRRGLTLLVLDTASDSAERLYERRGWQRVGTIPGFALLPNGEPCDTVYFYKQL